MKDRDRKMANIALLDTSIDSNNDGDEIIVEAILGQFPQLRSVPKLPTHRYLTSAELDVVDHSSFLIVTGTNILTSRMWRDRQWKLKISALRKMGGKVIFLGVGWRQYQGNPSRITQRMMEHIVNKDVPMSARDQYSAEKIRGQGFSAINTGCPTMWNLPAELPPLGSRAECVFTFTDYNPDISRDAAILNYLSSKYSAVHVWPQSDKDAANLERADLPKNVHRADRGVSALDQLVLERDYVGTRLHAGVRAAQSGSAALVVAVDNRALEISRDTGFPSVERAKGIEALERAYEAGSAGPTTMSLPRDGIDRWKSAILDVIGDRDNMRQRDTDYPEPRNVVEGK